MIYPATRIILILAAAAVLGLGQSTNPTGAIAGAGYLFPGQLSIAPGQVITIFTTGVPAATSFAGIGVTVAQGPAEFSASVLQVSSGDVGFVV